MPADTRRGRRPGPDRRRVPTTARPGRAWPGVAPCRARESWARPSPCRLASWASERSASRACPLEGGAPRRVTGAELQTDADDVDGTLGQRQPAQPHPVLLGGHEPDRLQRRGSLFEPAQVVGLVPVVVGESHERGGLHAELAEGGLEAGGCCDAGEREHARPGEITQPMRTHALGLPALDGAMTGGQHGHAGSVNVRGRAHLAEIRLAAGLRGGEGPPRRVRDDLPAAALPAVAAAHDDRPMAELQQRLHGHLHRRRLAGAADGEIADGDDGPPQPARAEHALLVQPLAGAEESAIAAGQRAQHRRGGRGEPALPAVHEPRPRVFGRHGVPAGSRKRSTRSSVAFTAPCRPATASWARPPIFARRTGSASRRVSSAVKAPPSRTRMPPPLSTRSAAASRKFVVYGPNRTGLRRCAGSSMLWPPAATRLPPTKTTSAIP